MDIRINNVLDVQFVNDDVSSFITLMGTLNKAISSSNKKVGFKKNGQLTIELDQSVIDFIQQVCENAGIIEEKTEED